MKHVSILVRKVFTIMTQTSPQSNDEKKSQVQDYFSRTAENYVASVSHSKGNDLKRLIEIGERKAFLASRLTGGISTLST
jgi:hypothetical protein